MILYAHVNISAAALAAEKRSQLSGILYAGIAQSVEQLIRNELFKRLENSANGWGARLGKSKGSQRIRKWGLFGVYNSQQQAKAHECWCGAVVAQLIRNQ